MRRVRRTKRRRDVREESLYVVANVKLLRNHRPLFGIETGKSSRCTTRKPGENVICGLWLEDSTGSRGREAGGLIILEYDVDWAVTGRAIYCGRAGPRRLEPGRCRRLRLDPELRTQVSSVPELELNGTIRREREGGRPVCSNTVRSSVW